MPPPPEVLLQTDNALVRRMHLGPLEQGEDHYHSEATEHVVCLVGELDVLIQDTRTLLRAGQAISIPANESHQVNNRLDSPAQYLLTQYGGAYDFCLSTP